MYCSCVRTVLHFSRLPVVKQFRAGFRLIRQFFGGFSACTKLFGLAANGPVPIGKLHNKCTPLSLFFLSTELFSLSWPYVFPFTLSISSNLIFSDDVFQSNWSFANQVEEHAESTLVCLSLIMLSIILFSLALLHDISEQHLSGLGVAVYVETALEPELDFRQCNWTLTVPGSRVRQGSSPASFHSQSD